MFNSMFNSIASRKLLSGAALLFSVLTVRASAQSPETPFFAEDLTRTKLGQISGLDEQVASKARMAPDGHMIITGAETDVWVPAGKFITLQPDLQITGFVPTTLRIFEDNQFTQTFGLEKRDLPVIRIDAPSGGSNRKVVQVVAYDAQRTPRLLMKCIVRARVANPQPAGLDYKNKNEVCAFNIKNRTAFQSGYLYLGDMYMGCVGDKTDKLELNERLLPPGKYVCQMVGQNEDGILMPGTPTSFEVASRYTISCADKSPIIHISEKVEHPQIRMTITHTPKIGIVSTRVYIAGLLACEKEGDEFTIDIPMKKIPTGISPVEVIGVDKDGNTYPVESIPINIKNEWWEQEAYHSEKGKKMLENRELIKKAEDDFAYWLGKATHEPALYPSGTIVTWDAIITRYERGQKSEFMGKAEEAHKRLVRLQLETGLLYRDLEMRTAAKNMLARVLREVSPRTAEYREAMNTLTKLKEERATGL